jgi:hypothetical protein
VVVDSESGLQVVGKSTLLRWAYQLKEERQGILPVPVLSAETGNCWDNEPMEPFFRNFKCSECRSMAINPFQHPNKMLHNI